MLAYVYFFASYSSVSMGKIHKKYKVYQNKYSFVMIKVVFFSFLYINAIIKMTTRDFKSNFDMLAAQGH